MIASSYLCLDAKNRLCPGSELSLRNVSTAPKLSSVTDRTLSVADEIAVPWRQWHHWSGDGAAFTTRSIYLRVGGYSSCSRAQLRAGVVLRRPYTADPTRSLPGGLRSHDVIHGVARPSHTASQSFGVNEPARAVSAKRDSRRRRFHHKERNEHT